MTKQEQIEMYVETQLVDYEETLRTQTDKGINKYNKIIDPLDDYSWTKMAKEELVDAHVYVTMVEKRVKFISSKLRKLMNYKETPATTEEINYWLDRLDEI